MTVASTAVEIVNLDPVVVPVPLLSAAAVAPAPLLLDLPNYYWYPSFYLR